jgi:hypothetical protein
MFLGGDIVTPGTIREMGLGVKDNGPGGHGLTALVGEYKRSSSIERKASNRKRTSWIVFLLGLSSLNPCSLQVRQLPQAAIIRLTSR